MFGFKTIREGERVAVWDKHGRVEYIAGPRRMLLGGGRTMEVLRRYAAGADEYLVVKFKDGHSQHLHGPAAVWFHPVEHESVRTERAINLDANEAVVVYSQEAEDRVGRRIVRGPALFMPAANEWLHEFAWHGTDPAAGGRKVPRALRFSKLRVIPDQMYFDVEDVRTADDALLVVKLMIFFELVDVERMLDQTHDPVADFINDVSADVIDFVAARGFDRFKESTDALNDLATYRSLTQRAERIGYRINKVVYRGYHASSKLQSMHDGAIESRTKLRLEAETERQAQELADLKLERESARALKRQEMEEAGVNHANRLKRLAHDEQLSQKQSEHGRRMEARRSANEVELTRLRESNRERLAFLQSMQSMQVDLTRYLVAQYQNPDRVIRIDGSGAAGNGNGSHTPQLHLHDRAV
jgi:hypothetical protein